MILDPDDLLSVQFISWPPPFRSLVSAMLQPSPQARPTVAQLVEAVNRRGIPGGGAEGMMMD